MTCLRHLYQFVGEGGLISLADYYVWDGCSRALHEFLSAASLTDRIYQYDNDVCVLIKKPENSALTVEVKGQQQWRRQSDPLRDSAKNAPDSGLAELQQPEVPLLLR
jgi:hypothetical protein